MWAAAAAERQVDVRPVQLSVYGKVQLITIRHLATTRRRKLFTDQSSLPSMGPMEPGSAPLADPAWQTWAAGSGCRSDN